MGIRVAAIVAVLTVTGCKYGTDAFNCGGNSAACGATGTCQANNLCSFPDGSCPSGQRYGDLGGTNSGQCVGQEPLPPDAMIDAPDAPPDARVCFGTGLVQVCLVAPPTTAFTPSGTTTIDTASSPMCAMLASGGDYCVVAATNIALTGILRATGAKPLVLLSTDSITSAAAAMIDVGSHRMRQVGSPESGAGADPTGCAAGTAPNTNGGGGAGGSFTGLGGSGGVGNNTPNTGGVPGAVAGPVTALRGGCAGQNGDGGTTDRGALGHGGGAVFLLALNKIEIGGGINAGGEAGAGADRNKAGGGGGGSGGMIGFDAPMITVTSLLVANGGGGGEGANQTTGGNDGHDATMLTAASGGSGLASNGGNGGDGSAGDAGGAGVSGLTGSDGGGGGGGGAGIILAPAAAVLGGMVSPAVTLQP